jgi:aspartyl-tRNA(Asn)/glutamyl-tRNA(Gln) amidotransferase subunit A
MIRITELRSALDSKKISAVELCRRSLDGARRLNSQYQSFLAFREEASLAEAKQADDRLASGDRSPLLGIPIAVKDNILVRGIQATAGSKMLEGYEAQYSATVVERLRAAGAVVVGKTNLDEFGMGSSNENSAYAPVKNPWNKNLVPGGSSGGSAAAVASGIVPLALGSDTGGSIRQPAALCGMVGLRPTYGRLSRWGLIAFASSLDQIGPLASCSLGAAAMMDAAAGYDPRDPTSSEKNYQPVYPEIASLTREAGFAGTRIGYDPLQLGEGVDEDVRRAFLSTLEDWKARGAQIHEVGLPNAKHSLASYYLIASSEASSNLARYSGLLQGHRSEKFSREGSLQDLVASSRSEGFGREVQRRILLGTFALSSGYYDAYFKRAAQVRRLILNDYLAALAKVDFFVSPTSPSAAFPLGEKSSNPLTMYLSDIFTLPSALAGLPAVSFPMGLSSAGLPIGLQAVSTAWNERKLFAFVRLNEIHRPESSLLRAPKMSEWGGLLS